MRREAAKPLPPPPISVMNWRRRIPPPLWGRHFSGSTSTSIGAETGIKSIAARGTSDVAFGSSSTFRARVGHFRSYPESRQSFAPQYLTQWAIFGLMYCFNLVGAGKQSRQLLRPDNSAVEGGLIDHLVG